MKAAVKDVMTTRVIWVRRGVRQRGLWSLGTRLRPP